MGIQGQLDQEAIDMLPKVKAEIEKASAFEANQMKYSTIQACCNASQRYRCAIAFMTTEEIEEFQSDLIDKFRFKEWIK